MKKYTCLAILLLLAMIQCSCKKFLDERPKSSLRIPSTAADFQALLDNYSAMNYMDISSAEVVAGDFYVSDADWASRKEYERRLYLWETTNVFLNTANEWMNTYNNVYRANTVIAGKSLLDLGNADAANVLGQAYYYRAKSFLELVGTYALAYDETEEQPGIPLRSGTDFNVRSTRATVTQSYQQIVSDLKTSIPLLPITPVHVLRPSKPAAYGLLSRALLFMHRYEEASLYADSCLKLKNNLIDYNTLNLSLTNPFVAFFNAETIHYTRFQNPSILSHLRARVSLEIINSYADGDLRKQAFYKSANGGYALEGIYSGETIPFGGLATDEIYLIRAECSARGNRVAEAMADLNTLISTRWDKNKVFTPYVASSGKAALALILQERRKELVLRGLRWMDIKRLNKEGYQIGLSRTINGEVFTLAPNSPRFANPIPEAIISISGMEQNKY